MERYEAMKKLSLQELKVKYDQLATHTSPGLGFYREEIARRELEEINHEMLSMTKHMRNMTIAISIMTFVNVITVLVQLS